MAGRIYALLVGINDYQSPVGKLDGCLNDVDRFHACLKGHAGATLDARVLKDAQATRANIIAGFRSHLGQATKDDVAVFHFCGHGARWASNAAFLEFFPDGKDEGLVCVDSRPNGYDLADKELAVLIGEVAARDAHVAVVLDCCHSGSGTRGVDVFRGLVPRLTDEVSTERPLESYLDGYYARLRDAKQRLSIPAARHIVLSACDRGQLAQESSETKGGVFTGTLVEVLEKSGGAVSYAELFARCRVAVRSRATDQDPQFETYGRFDAGAGFLGRVLDRTAARRYLAYFDRGAWMVECGAIHGLPTDPGTTVTLSLYQDDATTPAGSASVVNIGAQQSDIALDFESAESARYQAVLTSVPAAPVPMAFAGDDQTRADVQAALDADDTVHVGLVTVDSPASYVLTTGDGRLTFSQASPGSEIAFVDLAGAPADRGATALLPTLRHVLEWERLLALQNPRTKMTTSKVELVFEQDVEGGGIKTHSGDGVTLCSDFSREVTGRFKVRNRSGQTLHLALAYFSAAYEVSIQLNEPIASGPSWMTVWGDGENQYFRLPDGVNADLDRFRLIVSTEKVDTFLLELPAMEEMPVDVPLAAGGTRAVGPSREPFRNEWFTKPFDVRLARQLNRVGPTDAKAAGDRIVVKGHPSVTANLSLSAAKAAGRSVGASDFYRALEERGLPLVDFAAPGARGGDDLSVLELTDIQNASSLRDHPLEIELTLPLAADEGVLPVVYDGTHAYLGGEPEKGPDGTTRITIRHVPDLADAERGLGDSLKLYFFKTYLKHDDVNQLRWVEVASDGTISQGSDRLAERVAAARRVLLLVHGIIGDTRGMVAGVVACGLHRQFDLVLTYDYENLATPIEETARTLKTKLTAAGFGEGDDQHLTLLVHSMGGLVSRMFIEREGGHRMVDHLVMCGTPNHGSPFGRIDEARKIVSVLTSLALNYLPAAIPFASTVLFLLNRSKNLTPALEQMHPASPFIRTLNQSDDPGIPYTILAGDVAAYKEPADARFERLLAKAGTSVVFEALFGNQANDIAVGVESILGVQGERRLPPVQKNVACHHLNYFISTAGQQALKDVAW